MRVLLKRAFFRASLLLGLFRLSRHLARRKLIILCYHGFRMSDEGEFRPKLFMSRETFARRLALIRLRGIAVLPLDDALQRLYAGTLPDSAIAITIDDGFHSVGSVATEILKQRGFPATLYLTTYYVLKGTPIFRLVIQYMFWKTREDKLHCSDFTWLADSSLDLRDAARRDKVMWALIDYGERSCTEPERVSIARKLGENLRVDYQSIADRRILSLMTPAEVRQFAKAGFDVQLHSHRHQFPLEDENIARQEVADNREAISSMLGYTARHFCYPSGVWAAHQWPWLELMGVNSAATCESGLNSAKTPRLALRRFLDAESVSDIEFLAEMDGFAEFVREARRRVKTIARLPFRARKG